MAWYVSYELKNQKHNLEEFCRELMTKIEETDELRRFDCGIYNGVIWAETRHLTLEIDIYIELNEGSLVGAKLYNRDEWNMIINPEWTEYWSDHNLYDPFESDPNDLYTIDEMSCGIDMYLLKRKEIVGRLTKDDIILDYIEEHGITIKEFFTNKLKQNEKE